MNCIKDQVLIYYCKNCFGDEKNVLKIRSKFLSLPHVEPIEIPCSSKIEEIYLMRAFESGARGIYIFACSHDKCRCLEGSTRAEKRFNTVRNIFEEIGLPGDRIKFKKIDQNDISDMDSFFDELSEKINEMIPIFEDKTETCA